MSGALSRLLTVPAALVMVGMVAAACSSSPSPGTAAGGGTTVGVMTKAYDSAPGLLGDTTLAVVATLQSVRPDGTLPDGRPEWRLKLQVISLVKGRVGAGDEVTAVGAFGRSARSAPVKTGHTYLLLLGRDPNAHGHLAVVGGVFGVFSVDENAQTVHSLAPPVGWLPQSLSLSLAEVELGGTPAVAAGTTTTTTAPGGGSSSGCPPGCRLTTTFDGVTWLASQSTSVAIDVAEANPDNASSPQYPIVFAVRQNLEHSLAVGSTLLPTGSAVVGVTLHRGQDYLVFISLGRGGPCISTVYSYDKARQLASLIGEYRTSIPLPGGRTLPVPKSLTLAQVQDRMYPTGQVVQSTDTSESLCPE